MKIFNWISKLFKKEQRSKEGNMVYDIIVYEEDELADGSMGVKQHQEMGVKASSRKELIGLYAMTGSRIKIIREYSDEPINQVNVQPQPQYQDKTNTSLAKSEVSAQPNNDDSTQTAGIATTNIPDNLTQIDINRSRIAKPKPKLFTVGGVECKLDDGKLYQKQWVKLSSNETELYRIVNDINNKIVPLNGKHIEMKKWILVEDESKDDVNTSDKSQLLVEG